LGLNPRLTAQRLNNIFINGSQQFRLINGFGVNAKAASWNNGELRPAHDLIVRELGATLWRVAIDTAVGSVE
jgi:hypothetical protein